MLHSLTNLCWSGAGYVLQTTLPGRLYQTLLASSVLGDPLRDAQPSRQNARRRASRGLSNPSRGFQSRCGEWAALREWSLCGCAPLAKLEAERVFLCAQGVRGRGVLKIGGRVIAAFADGDWEIEITQYTVEQEEAPVELAFEPGMPAGFLPHVPVGVDGGLFIRGVNQCRVTDLNMTPRIEDGYGVLEAKVVVSPYVPGRYVFRYAAQYGEETLAVEEITEKLYAVETAFVHRVVLPLPRRWVTGAENELILTRLTITRSGLVCDDRLQMTGFREASFSEGGALQLYIDGQRVFLKGAEWTGCQEALLADEEVGRRLALLKAAHINCVRVHGGETDAFYDALDRQGFLLWQMLPGDVEEAIAIVRRVRHRPALIAYGGDEAEAVRDIVEAYDGSHPLFGADALGETLETFPGPEELCGRMNGDDAAIRAVACPAPAADLATLANGEAFWPPEGPLWTHLAAKPLEIEPLLAWSGLGRENQHLARLARYLQAETVRYAVERARMRASMATGVFVADPFERWPSLCSTAMFDETGARPSYWALESALRPLHGCARLESLTYPCGASFVAEICLLCDALVMGLLTVRVKLFGPDGAVLAETRKDAKPETSVVGTLCATLPREPSVLLLRIMVDRFGEEMDVNDYVLCVSGTGGLEPAAEAPPARFTIADSLLRNVSGQMALGVTGGVWAEAQYPGWGALLAGESRAVKQENIVDGLNLESVKREERDA